MEHTMNPEVQEMGHLIKETIENEVTSGLANDYLGRIAGYHHKASQWVDLEDSPDSMWYLATDGDLYLETDIGRDYLTTLSFEVMSHL
jgi:hypothetical protein